MSTILALEASSEACSVALRFNGASIEKINNTPRSHAKSILPLVKSIIDEAGITLKMLDAIAFGEGPGSFTGLRICLSSAQGLAFGGDLPLIPVSSHAALAVAAINQLGITQPSRIVVVTDARMQEIYGGAFDFDGETISAMSQVDQWILNYADTEIRLGQSLQATSSNIIVGNACGLLPEEITAKFDYKDEALEGSAVGLLDIAESKLSLGEVLSPHLAEPTYLRNSIAWEKRKRIRQSSDSPDSASKS